MGSLPTPLEVREKISSITRSTDYNVARSYKRAIDNILQVYPLYLNNTVAPTGTLDIKQYPHLERVIDKEIDALHRNILGAVGIGANQSLEFAGEYIRTLVKNNSGREFDGSEYEYIRSYVERTDVRNSAKRIKDRTKEVITISVLFALANRTSESDVRRTIRYDIKHPDRLVERVSSSKDITVDAERLSYIQHPGNGVPVSPTSDAFILSSAEVHSMFCIAMYTLCQNIDFVAGMRIDLAKGHPVPDICDDLVGDYPKWFLFRGWHPRCWCIATPIVGVEQITKLPVSFMHWADRNKGRISKWGANQKLPNFIKDNFSISRSGGLSKIDVSNRFSLVSK